MEYTRVTATGTVKATGTIVKKLIVTPAAAIVTIVLRDGGAGGTVKMDGQAAASGQTVDLDFIEGITFSTDIHATVTGAGAVCYVGY